VILVVGVSSCSGMSEVFTGGEDALFWESSPFD
jgi:hypothetical protein